MKLLKRVVRKINLLYAKINDIDMETRAHQQTMGLKKKELQTSNEELSSQIQELVGKINRAKAYHAFTETDVANVSPESFLEQNPVPYNFSSIIKDYKLMDVFK